LRSRLQGLSRAAAVALVACLAASAPVGAEGAARTTWGDPDLRGIWDFRTITPLERPSSLAGKEFLSDEEAAVFEEQTLERLDFDRRDGGSRFDVERAYNNFWWDWGDKLTDDKRTSLIVDPPDGRIPAMVPEAKDADRARRRSGGGPVRERVLIGSKAHGPEDLGLSERCLLGFNSGPPMLPSAYNNNLQLFQSPGYVVLLNEMIHAARVIPLDGRSHLDGRIRQWMGDSRGRWEGDTLVVDSTNFTDKTPSFSGVIGAMGSGETLHLIERFTRVSADTLLYEFTIDDPHTFTASWTAAIPMKKTDGPLFEYACHEGNYGMANLLSGARAQEEAAAQSKKP